MYTNAIMLIAGLAGFVLCEIFSLVILRFSRLMQVIAAVFGWVAITGIVFSFTGDLFPENAATAILAAGVAALAVMVFGIFVVWSYLRIEKYVKTRIAG